MTVARFAISMDEELARKVRKAAGATPMSSWLSDAAERKLRAEGLLRAVTAWEAKHGELVASELEGAARKRRAPRSRARRK
jgi:hypothetical protein